MLPPIIRSRVSALRTGMVSAGTVVDIQTAACEPKALREGDLFVAAHVEINLGRAEAGMAKPFLEEGHGNGRQRGNTKAVTEAPRAGVASENAGARHDTLDDPPRRDAVPRP